MRDLTIDVTDLGGQAHPGDTVLLWKPDPSGSAEVATRIISTAPRTVHLVDGKATVPGVEPGPMRVLFRCRGLEATEPVTVTVPDGNGPVTLRSLYEGQFQYEPPVVSAVQRAADNAADSERASLAAKIRAEAAADRADARVDQALTDGANLVRNEVKSDADRAVAAREGAQLAQSSAEEARDTAVQAATTAGNSATAAASAEANTKTSETNADKSAKDAAADRIQTGKDREATGSDRTATGADRAAAAGSAATATTEADRAKDEADRSTTQAERAKTEADRAKESADQADGAAVEAVTARVNTLLEGAPEAYDTLREVGEKLAAQDDVASALTAQIGQKADTTDADGRTVVRYEAGSSQWIRVGDNGYDGGSYMNGGALNLRSADWRYASKASTQALADGLAGKADTAVVNARPALFSGTGAPPSSIPNARVGDWWLNQSTMELSKITGV